MNSALENIQPGGSPTIDGTEVSKASLAGTAWS